MKMIIVFILGSGKIMTIFRPLKPFFPPRFSQGDIQEDCTLTRRIDSPWHSACATLRKEPETGFHEIEVFAIPLKMDNAPFMQRVRKTAKIIV
ncbi:MAG: hypothetical protein K6U80_12035 [Firmicutes bacterium]|nr:hypothetical protein [Bacillota bacterium]